MCVLLSHFTSQAAKNCFNKTKGTVVHLSGTYAASGNGTQVHIALFEEVSSQEGSELLVLKSQK